MKRLCSLALVRANICVENESRFGQVCLSSVHLSIMMDQKVILEAVATA